MAQDSVDRDIAQWMMEIPDLDPIEEGVITRVQMLVKHLKQRKQATIGRATEWAFISTRRCTCSAALGLAALMAGAVATNLTIGYSPWVPLAFLLVSALMVWSRWPQTRALATHFSR